MSINIQFLYLCKNCNKAAEVLFGGERYENYIFQISFYLPSNKGIFLSEITE